jgi:hypothetical protein
MKKNMVINNPEIIKENGIIQYRVSVKSKEGGNILWYSLSDEYEHLLSETADAALIALLIPAMTKKEDIHIKGIISERLYWNIVDRYQFILKLLIPSLNIINIFPTELREEEISKSQVGVATGFSGGIDSFCVLNDYFYRHTTPGFRLTHLLFNNVGSHGTGSEYLFKERFFHLKKTAEIFGLPFISINSNLSIFYEGHNFQQTHTHRNASVAHLLKGGIKRFLYASTFSYNESFIGPTYDIAYCDPIILPLLSSESTDLVSVGGKYTRVEKTLKVANLKESYNSLNICVNATKAENCSVCWKCMRTLLVFDIAGCLNLYQKVFDIDAYDKKRNDYIAKVIISKDPLLMEIKKYAKNNGFRFPIMSYIYAYIKFNKVFRLLKSAKKKFFSF